MTDRSTATTASATSEMAKPITKGAIMKSFIRLVMAVMVTVSVASAKELPNAPSAVIAAEASPVIVEAAVVATAPRVVEKPVIDRKFVALSIMSAGATFADSYTTMFATQNWLAGKTNVCNVEVQSPYLYGTHPTAPRVYAVASAKSAVSIFAAYYLRKHHSKFWAAPLLANSAISLQGVTQNMRACN
ncbi:MAG TPA: hypothetical protein VGS78_16100 [Candidatus Sulfotelmatobacter sp.]|nr:hypothetical protein [Candidatus Sulfotelmatobacter sp.]